MRQRKALISIYGPSNLIGAAAALRTATRIRNAGTPSDVTLLLHHPQASPNTLAEYEPLVRTLASTQGWSKLLILSPAEMNAIIPDHSEVIPIEARSRFCKLFGDTLFDDFYFAHDAFGYANQLAMQAYPKAQHYTYGGGLGMMVDRHYVQARQTGKGWNEGARAATPSPCVAKEALLALPMDETGDCLQGKQLTTVPRTEVLAVCDEFSQALPELTCSANELLGGISHTPFLLLLESIADGGFCTVDNEIALYSEIVRRYVSPGATLFIKGHPLANHPIEERLATRLKSEYDTRRIPAKLHRYPMELWSSFVRACEVISFSYCSISLQYIYGKRIVYPADMPALYRKYLYPKGLSYFIEGDLAISSQRNGLESWDGESVIWTGARSTLLPATN